jgi:hypothetical protein
MLSSGANVIIWDYMLSSGMKRDHLGYNVIIWDKMLSSGANVIMVSYGASVIIWCYHVMLSSGMITHPLFIFPENFTHSILKKKMEKYAGQKYQIRIHILIQYHYS